MIAPASTLVEIAVDHGGRRYNPRVRHSWGIVTGTVIGVTFGAAVSLVNNVPAMLGEVGQAHSQDSAATWAAIFLSLILDSGWAWATLAFVLGWLAGTQGRRVMAALVGASAGAAGLIAATVTYYSTDRLFGIEFSWGATTFWLVRAVAFGLPLGAMGSVTSWRSAVASLAALTIPAGAAINMLLLPMRHGLPGESSAAGWAQLSVWIAAVAGAALVVARYLRIRTRGSKRA